MSVVPEKITRRRPIPALFALAALLFLITGSIAAQPAAAEPARYIAVNRSTVQIPDPHARATVLIFIAHDCPISNSYAPEINRISKHYTSFGLPFILVYAEPGYKPSQAAAHMAAYGYHCPAIVSGWKTLVQETGVIATPEAAVLASDGTLLYRGRIDDLYASFGVRRAQAHTHDLSAALDNIVTGKPVAVARTVSIGCFIPH